MIKRMLCVILFVLGIMPSVARAECCRLQISFAANVVTFGTSLLNMMMIMNTNSSIEQTNAEAEKLAEAIPELYQMEMDEVTKLNDHHRQTVKAWGQMEALYTADSGALIASALHGLGDSWGAGGSASAEVVTLDALSSQRMGFYRSRYAALLSYSNDSRNMTPSVGALDQLTDQLMKQQSQLSPNSGQFQRPHIALPQAVVTSAGVDDQRRWSDLKVAQEMRLQTMYLHQRVMAQLITEANAPSPVFCDIAMQAQDKPCAIKVSFESESKQFFEQLKAWRSLQDFQQGSWQATVLVSAEKTLGQMIGAYRDATF